MAVSAETIQERSQALLRAIRGTGAGDYSPIHDRILVKRLDLDHEEERESGIVVVRNDDRERRTGKALVVAVGPGRVRKGSRIPPAVKPGDVILAGKHIGHPIEIDGTAYALVKEGDALAILREDG